MQTPARQRGSIGRFFTATLVVIMILALLGAVGYLLSDINHRRYRINVRDGQMWVERGLFLPVGFAPYQPETPALREAYAAIPVPLNETVAPSGPVDERSDIDRVIFNLLAGWARSRVAVQDTQAQQQAMTFVKRLEILPGLSEEQRVELHGLRAAVAFQDGVRLMEDATLALRRAQEAFRLAIVLGGPQAREAQRFINELDRRLDFFAESPPQKPAIPRAPSK